MGKADYYKHGDWNAICDYCGEKFKASQLKKTWDGFYACQKDWNPRHPQDFLKGVKDDPSVEWTRPEGEDVEVDNSSWQGRTDVPDGHNDGSL